jgi:glycosyltransferase involved in cell wall biosynthesis
VKIVWFAPEMGNYSSGIVNHNRIFVEFLHNHPEVEEVTVVKYPLPENGIIPPLLEHQNGIRYYTPRIAMDYHGAFDSILQADLSFLERLKVRFFKLALKFKRIKRLDIERIKKWGQIEFGLIGMASVQKPFPNPFQKQIGRCIAKLHPDIIQSHMELFTVASSLARDAAKGHISYQVIVEEEKESLPPRSITRAFWDRMDDALKWLIEHQTVDTYIAASEYVERQLYARGFRSQKVEVIYSPVIMTQLAPRDKAKARAYLGIPQDKRVILSVGRVLERKKFIDIIHALKDLPHDVIFYLKQSVSTSDEVLPSAINQLHREIKRLKLEQRVVINSEVLPYDQMRLVYSAADVAVYPFLYEPFGMCAVEAMAARLPIIVYNSGYLPAFINGNGFVVEPNDHEDLCQKTQMILDDPALGDEMGTKGQELVKRYDINVLGEKLLNIYREYV